MTSALPEYIHWQYIGQRFQQSVGQVQVIQRIEFYRMQCIGGDA
jgi:hypothetical protein